MHLSLYCNVWKGLLNGLRVRGNWRPNGTAIYWPHCYGRQRCAFLVLQGCSTGGPAAQLSAGWWLSLLHLISHFSGPQTPSGFPRAPSARCGFPYHISSIIPTVTPTQTFFKSPQTSACFRCVTSLAPCHPVSSRTIMTSEWHLHLPARARINTYHNVASN